MARAAGKDDTRDRRRWGATSLLGTAVWWLALLLLVLYGVLQVGVRTEIFRRWLEGELSRIIGLKVQIGHVRATESLNLKVRNVIMVAEEGGFDLRVVRIRWRLIRPRGGSRIESVRVDGWEATFAADGAGPLAANAIAEIVDTVIPSSRLGSEEGSPRPAEPDEGAEQTPGWEEGALGSIPRVEMRWGTVHVRDAEGNMRLSALGLDCLWTVSQLPAGGRVAHVDLTAEELQLAGGTHIAGLHVELSDYGDRLILTSARVGDWGGETQSAIPGEDYRALFEAMDAQP
ncbi:MAG: hypothetical protein GX803_01345 [Lentisphaerae bacterium]|jgi:hypothetical protein|nr:hypothetical protein [Lentisphaerota bacterium]